MKTNPVKQKLLKGQPVFGSFGWEFLVPGLPQIVKGCGAEFLLIDMEHAGTGYETLKDQAALCRGLDLVPMARVPSNQYHHISRALDLGVMGIMVPMVGSAEEARHIVSCTRYPPAGRRGAAFGFASDDYEGGSVAEKIKLANEPGVDVLWLGHFDLTNFLGIPAQFDHPKYVKAIDKLVAAAKKHGKVLACATGDDQWSRDYWNKGFRLFAMGIDSMLLQGALRAGMSTLNGLKGSAAPKKKK